MTDPDLIPDAPEPGSAAGSVWLWLLVVAFGLVAAAAGYSALSKSQLYWESEAAREALQGDKSRLEANIADVKQQLTQANTSKEETENALRQSRADTETALTQIGQLQTQVNELEKKRTAAAAETSQAKDARATAEDEAGRLKDELKATQAKLDGANASLGEMHAKLADAEKRLADAQRNLAETQKRLDAALADLAKAKAQRDSATPPAAAPQAETSPPAPAGP
jgi:chromosome segregation ATPase